MRLALFVVLCLAPRASHGQWTSPGESCSSDSGCYGGKLCAGGVCCFDTKWGTGMQNCTQHGLGNDGLCTQCAEGGLSSTTADAGRHVAAQRSTEIWRTTAMRSTKRALVATVTTNACRGSVARITIVVTATTPRPTEMGSAAFIANPATDPASNAVQVHHVLLANASSEQTYEAPKYRVETGTAAAATAVKPGTAVPEL